MTATKWIDIYQETFNYHWKIKPRKDVTIHKHLVIFKLCSNQDFMIRTEGNGDFQGAGFPL